MPSLREIAKSLVFDVDMPISQIQLILEALADQAYEDLEIPAALVNAGRRRARRKPYPRNKIK